MPRPRTIAIAFGLMPVLALTVACGRKLDDGQTPVAPKPEALPYRQASASEVFNLRTRCAEIAEKMVNDDAHGAAVSITGTSHYNPKTNRCYVLLDSSGVDDPVKLNHQYLFDGQTKDMLAFSGTANGKQTGTVFADWKRSDPNERNLTPFEQAGDYIREQMSDDRSD